MNKAQKTEVAEELQKRFEGAAAIFTADFRGLPVADITALRFELKKSQTDFKVVKNRVALRAMKYKDYGAFVNQFDYMTGVVFTQGDPSAAAKTLTKFAETNKNLQLRGGYLDGKVISLNEIKALSKLPSKQELLAKMLGTLVAVPTGFVRVLNGVPAKWVYLLDAVRRQKEEK